MSITAFLRVSAGKFAPVAYTKTINGQLRLRGNETVQEKTLVNGQLIAHDIIFAEHLKVNGSTSCGNCQFKKESRFNGKAEFDGCDFENVEFAGSVSFRNTRAKTVYVVAPHMHSRYGSVVSALNNTRITRIEFLEGRGRVYASKDSKIDQVINGDITYQP